MPGIEMFRFIFLLLFAISLSANSLIVNVGAKSDHLVKGEFNESNHNWLGLGYRFIEKDKYSVQIETVKFVNSYYEPTKFVALTGIYTPIKIGDVKLGVSLSTGWQDGYYVNHKGTHHPKIAKELGLDNSSLLFLYSLYAEVDNIVINYTYIPNSVQACTVGFKAIEW
jgi:hypothetical protein